MIQLSFVRQSKGLPDFTWIELHYQFCAGITFLFTLWTSLEVRNRAKAEWTMIKSCLAQWEIVLGSMVKRWPKVSRARDILVKLADLTVEIVEREMMGTSQQKVADRYSPSSGGQYVRSSSLNAWLGQPGDDRAGLHRNPTVQEAPVETQTVGIHFRPMPTDQNVQPHEILASLPILDQTAPADRPWNESTLNLTGFPPECGNGLSSVFSGELWRTWGLPSDEQQLYHTISGLEHFGNVGRWPYDDIAGLADVDVLDPIYTDSALNFHGDTNPS